MTSRPIRRDQKHWRGSEMVIKREQLEFAMASRFRGGQGLGDFVHGPPA